METLPFATTPAALSIWGCNSVNNNSNCEDRTSFMPPSSQHCKLQSHRQQKKESRPAVPETSYSSNNLEYMPAVLLNTLKREKKPFTYTPGRIDLSEVLNDNLQKRLEKRKKRALQRSFPLSPPPPVQETPTFDPPKQVLVMPTYNSPLNMYSMENALEALEVQAGLTVADNSFSPPPLCQSMTLPRNYKFEANDYEPKNVAQSKAFKVLQIITDTEEEAEQNGQPSPVTRSHQDEMRFTGIRTSDAIPSKFFHNLQKIAEQAAPTSPTKNTDRYYDEMRFSGTLPTKAIPSKLFHNLQKMTGTEDIPNDVGAMNPTNTGVWEVRFRPKDSLTKQDESSYKFEPQQHVRKAKRDPSIPVLQRPAAFLPAKQSMAKNYVSCSPRFNAMSSLPSSGRANF